MSRYIDKDALIEAMGEEPYVWTDSDDEIAERNQWLTDMHIIESARSIDIEPKRGEWIEADVIDIEDTCIEEIQTLKCSVCGRIQTKPYMYYVDCDNYCPNCGADMRKGADDEMR